MSLANASYLPVMGKALSAAEKASLQCSIPLLSARFDGAPAEFWGKVCGYKNDYLVAQVLPHGPLGARVGFYSTDSGNNWTLLEDLTEEQATFCEELRGVYQGVPQYEYKARKDIPAPPEPEVVLPEGGDLLAEAKAALEKANGEQDEDEEDEEDEEDMDEEEEEEEEEFDEAQQRRKKDRRPKFMIVTITEAKRLSHFVQLHDAACRLAVRGELILSPEGAVAASSSAAANTLPSLVGATRNQAFGGQPLHYAMKPSCYVKIAARGKSARNSVLYGATYNPHTDFLRPITDDAPQGVWSVKYEPMLNVVAVTNWLYEGSLFWYRPDTLERGQVYVGNGERNFELFLML